MKKINKTIFLFFLIINILNFANLIGNIFDFAGYVRFYSKKTDKMIFVVDSGKGLEKVTIGPGESGTIKIKGWAPRNIGMLKVDAYYEDKSLKNYRGTYVWQTYENKEKIRVDRGKLTRVYLEYKKTRDGNRYIERKVFKPVKKKKGRWLKSTEVLQKYSKQDRNAFTIVKNDTGYPLILRFKKNKVVLQNGKTQFVKVSLVGFYSFNKYSDIRVNFYSTDKPQENSVLINGESVLLKHPTIILKINRSHPKDSLALTLFDKNRIRSGNYASKNELFDNVFVVNNTGNNLNNVQIIFTSNKHKDMPTKVFNDSIPAHSYKHAKDAWIKPGEAAMNGVYTVDVDGQVVPLTIYEIGSTIKKVNSTPVFSLKRTINDPVGLFVVIEKTLDGLYKAKITKPYSVNDAPFASFNLTAVN